MDALGIADGAVGGRTSGAGGGWFTVRLAQRVGPHGLVYAEDIQPQMIESINRRVRRAGLTNVQTIIGTASNPLLPAPIDALLMVEVYGQVEDPVTLLRERDPPPEAGGRVGIVEYKLDGGGPGPPFDERVEPATVIPRRRGGRVPPAGAPEDRFSLPVPAGLRPETTRARRPDSTAHSRRPAMQDRPDHRRERLGGRRRHSGRPEDVRRVRRSRPERRHRRHRPEPPAASPAPTRFRPASSRPRSPRSQAHFPIAAVKTGMLADGSIVDVVCRHLEGAGHSSGGRPGLPGVDGRQPPAGRRWRPAPDGAAPAAGGRRDTQPDGGGNDSAAWRSGRSPRRGKRHGAFETSERRP